jgi:hypothetical protein
VADETGIIGRQFVCEVLVSIGELPAGLSSTAPSVHPVLCVVCAQNSTTKLSFQLLYKGKSKKCKGNYVRGYDKIMNTIVRHTICCYTISLPLNAFA